MGNYYREIVEALKAAGCMLARPGHGSHEIWFSPITRRNVTVPIGTTKRHTANAIMKQAGLAKRF